MSTKKIAHRAPRAKSPAPILAAPPAPALDALLVDRPTQPAPLGDMSTAERLLQYVSPGDDDPVHWGLRTMADDLEPLIDALVDRRADHLCTLQTRLRVLAELHTRQRAEERARVRARAEEASLNLGINVERVSALLQELAR